MRDIWKAYLMHFVSRYGGKKVERTRDLFRQAIDEVSCARVLGMRCAWGSLSGGVLAQYSIGR